MKIKTDELRKFLSAASQIRPNPLFQNLDSIKIECTGNEIIFTKTNNNIWCTYSYVSQPSIPECYLVNERVLNGITTSTKEYQIDITPAINDPKTLLITNGEYVLKNPNQDLTLFPIIQPNKNNTERIKLSKSTVDCIRIASKYLSNAQVKTAMSFVQTGMVGIFAFNGSIAYYQNIFGLPEVFFDEEPLNIMRPTDEALYWTTESYDYFSYEGFTYAFIKHVIKPMAAEPILKQTGTNSFAVNKQGLIDFCVQVQYAAKNKLLIASFQTNNNNLDLFYSEPEYNNDVTGQIQIAKTGDVNKFNFNIEQMLLLLKSIPYEQVVFTECEKHYKITTKEDENYIGIMVKMG